MLTTESHTQHRHYCKEENQGVEQLIFLQFTNYIYKHKECILINFFSSIVEYHMFVYTRVFLNRVASYEQLKNNNKKYQNNISPVIWLTVATKAN